MKVKKLELPATPKRLCEESIKHHFNEISEAVKAESARFDIKTKEGREGIKSLVFLLDDKWSEIGFLTSYKWVSTIEELKEGVSSFVSFSEEISSLKMQITYEMRNDDRNHIDLINLIEGVDVAISNPGTLESTVKFYLNRLDYIESTGFKGIRLGCGDSFDVREDMFCNVFEAYYNAKQSCEKRLAEIKLKEISNETLLGK